MKRSFAILLALLAWLSAPGQAAVWSLDSCIGYAATHNSTIQLAATDLYRSRVQLARSKAELLPTLQLYVNQYYNWGRSVDMQELVIVKNRLTRQTSASVGATFSIFDGFARLNTIAANRAALAAARESADQAALDVNADIARAYLGNILARQTLECLTQRYFTLLTQLSKAEAQMQLGQRSRSDILEIEAQAADVKSQMAEAEAEEETQMQQLQKLMGCTESFETESVFPDSDDMEVPEGIPLTTPAVAAAHKGVEAARYALKAARGELLPKLSLSASYGTYYSDAAGAQFKEQIDGNRNPSVSLNLVVPLFSAGKGAAAIALARADIQAQEVKVRQAEEQARFTFEQMRRQCICLQEQIRSCRARVQLCRQRLRDADARYDLGMVSSSDWLDAEKDLAQSECDLIQSRCKYLFQLIILEMYNDGWQE